jgi:hypothetical protein
VLERFGEDETFFGWRMSDTLFAMVFTGQICVYGF